MTLRDDIIDRLTIAFAPVALDVEDESDRHAGHVGARVGGETHFRVRVVSAAFKGVARIERHRRINAVLAPAFARGMHALAIEADVPA